VRLDSVFYTVAWEEAYPNALLQSSASDDSDHYPLFLGLRDNKTSKHWFHFETLWPKLEGFLEAVEGAWNSVQQGSCPFSTLNLKLRVVAKGLQAWSDKKIMHVESQLAIA
jgi:hypothetical protein